MLRSLYILERTQLKKFFTDVQKQVKVLEIRLLINRKERSLHTSQSPLHQENSGLTTLPLPLTFTLYCVWQRSCSEVIVVYENAYFCPFASTYNSPFKINLTHLKAMVFNYMEYDNVLKFTAATWWMGDIESLNDEGTMELALIWPSQKI